MIQPLKEIFDKLIILKHYLLIDLLLHIFTDFAQDFEIFF